MQLLSVSSAPLQRRVNQDWRDRDTAVGAVGIDELNAHGGWGALRHPFGATAERMVTTMPTR